jgi:type II secretory pathway pseudopilin PulG
MDPANRSNSVRTCGFCRRPHGVAGFTLVEVALAALVLMVAILALFGTMVNSYRMTQKTRARDQARALLQSYVDKFLREPIATQVFFQTCSAATLPGTGDGISWDWGNTRVTGNGSGGIEIRLGGSGDVAADQVRLKVKIWRWVSELDEDTGVANESTAFSPIGRMIVGTFTAQYKINEGQGSEQTETMTFTVARTDEFQ